MQPARPRLAVALAAFPLLVLDACVAHVVLHDDHPVYTEVEPNDSALTAPFYGGLVPGDAFSIVGHVQESGFDLYDGAEVRVDAPCELVFDLTSRGYDTDLDVCLYDPDLGEFVVCADGPSDPEHGSVIVLEAGKRLQLVVTSAWGDAEYTLSVRALPTYGALATAPDEHVDAAAANVDETARAAKEARRRGYLPARTVRIAQPGELVVYDLERGVVERRAAVLERTLAPATER